MIRGWKNDAAREAFEGKTPKGFSQEVAKAARRKLAQLDAAADVTDMASPPGNRLKKYDGVWWVRVNDQFRIMFSWGADGPTEVWLGDPH